MSPANDKRFESALKNLSKALAALERSATTPIQEPRDLSDIIKDFEIFYELSWKTLRKYLEKQGQTAQTARQSFSVAYQAGLIANENVWLEIIDDRTKTVHMYGEA